MLLAIRIKQYQSVVTRQFRYVDEVSNAITREGRGRKYIFCDNVVVSAYQK